MDWETATSEQQLLVNPHVPLPPPQQMMTPLRPAVFLKKLPSGFFMPPLGLGYPQFVMPTPLPPPLPHSLQSIDLTMLTSSESGDVAKVITPTNETKTKIHSKPTKPTAAVRNNPELEHHQ
ncbi:hypothetical protein U1Q18_042394 [Sarracenia purpurea var. burkii]